MDDRQERLEEEMHVRAEPVFVQPDYFIGRNKFPGARFVIVAANAGTVAAETQPEVEIAQHLIDQGGFQGAEQIPPAA